ncbi:NAD(P)/FAD-dependent oxidoreductase [Oceanimonas baumannii]|uniref:FAD-dependent oxidoreductase n=1 Tax=Oceanimonas baumannii TaxID=129578 RepID=A0A235CKU2_9GAMM|nr:FAD-binding oxidoreductase [Oceanimonas baumannii]OYD25160.1 FAD-dependent oxidoreductase [Oceanimonas baumannii]TDW62554.1 glycine/D-amino acid oxidase-like deaminating enzyme [Oceanimonas baumannii]
MQKRCLWYDTSPEPALPLAQLEGHDTCEVVVIGGGITGLSTALHLAEIGVSVTLIEAGDIPSGGSGRNVGFVNAGLWIPPEDIVNALGKADGERVNTLLGDAPAEVFSLIERYDIDCNATRTGTLHLAHNRQGEKELARRVEQFQRRGAPVELLEDDLCHQHVGTQRIKKALLDRRAGTINPTSYTRGLARAAHGLGVKMHTQTPATGVIRQGDDWQVMTPKGSVKASRVVLATNAYTDSDWNQVRRHFFAGHYFQVASPPLPDKVAGDILPGKQGAWDTRTVLSSIRRDAHGRLLLGSLGKGEGKPLSYIRCWANRVQQYYFPQLGKIDWQYTWTGRIAFTPDNTCRLFEPAPGIVAVTGYNGRGVTTGTVVGKGFARYLTCGDDALLPMPIRSHSPIKAKSLWAAGYESGFTLYHTGQCLRLLA